MSKTKLRLLNGMRVRCIKEPLQGKLGTVVRVRRGDDGAWVHMDDPLPQDLRSFPADDSRADHIVLFPEECQEAK